ncbi:MAG TPA: hypothetical protein PKW03_03635 [Acetivibrio sp.]|nr:hypothetical protein [Acetivibrio sp.]HPT90627.1 hypothetical protein [Acetivibrio sp.]
MHHSKAYNQLLAHVNATGREKDGYYPNILEEIYDYERDSAEDIIWKAFHDGDIEVVMYLPKLKKYNGVSALKKALSHCNIPSYRSIRLAEALYSCSKHKKYLDIIISNLRSNSQSDRVAVLHILMKLDPNERIFEIFEQVCLNDVSDSVRLTAATGLLYCKGYVKNPFSIQEFQQTLSLHRLLAKDTFEERQKNINALRDGKLERC